MGSTTNQIPVTPNRETRVRIDVDDVVGTEPAFGMERLLGQIGRAAKQDNKSCYFVQSVGWILRPLAADIYRLHERNQAATYFLLPSNGSLVIPPGFQEEARFRKNTDQPGATGGAAADMPSTGDIFIVKKVPSGASWDAADFRLAADQTAFPGPDTANDSIVMDRVGISTEPHEPFQSLYFRFMVPAAPHASPDRAFKFYFNAPPTADGEGRGYGNYCVIPTIDGSLLLWEYGLEGPDFTNSAWIFRSELRFKDRTAQAGRTGSLFILPGPASRSASISGKILFAYGPDNATGFSVTDELSAVVAFANRATYQCRHDGSVSATPRNEKLRVDMRRDMRCAYQVCKGGYLTTGTIRDDVFCLPLIPQSSHTIRVEVYGYFPTGCSIGIDLEDASPGGGGSLVMTASGPLSGTPTPGYYADFNTRLRVSQYQPVYTLTGTGSETPILRSARIIRNGVEQLISIGETVANGVMHASGTGAESDPSHETAGVVIEDLNHELGDVLGNRSDHCVVIETTYDADHPDRYCGLFRGYMERNPGKRKGKTGHTYPHEDWSRYELALQGVWTRFSEVKAPTRFSWSIDPNGPDDGNGNKPPYKVTDILSLICQWAGFPLDLIDTDSSMIDLPDYEIRLFSVGSDDQMLIELFADLGELAMKLARDYLGEALVFDPNRGTYGKWILVQVPRAPYTNKAYFTESGPGAGKAVHHLASYGTKHIAASATTTDVTVQICPIIKGSIQRDPRKPDCNHLTVSGSGQFDSSTKQRLTQTVINYDSYNPIIGLSTATPTNNPDYIGRPKYAFYIDPALQTPEAVNWVARRIYDVAMHGYELVSFLAPLIFIEHESDATRVRPLRFGDPVQIDDRQYIVRNVNFDIEKDSKQLAHYELQEPRI